jgi:hypothetical protein
VRKILGNSIVLLKSIDEEELILVNVHKLKPYTIWVGPPNGGLVIRKGT